jgi:hypothetical protein
MRNTTPEMKRGSTSNEKKRISAFQKLKNAPLKEKGSNKKPL